MNNTHTLMGTMEVFILMNFVGNAQFWYKHQRWGWIMSASSARTNVIWGLQFAVFEPKRRASNFITIWNRTRSRAHAQNQHPRELISARKMSHKHNKVHKLLCTSYRGCTSGGAYVRCIYSHAMWELPQATRVFVVVFVWRLSSAN